MPATPPPTPPAPTKLVVHIDSIPPGASVTIDGEAKGTTPYDLELAAPKQIALDLALDGHTTVHQQLELDKDQRLLIPLPELPVAAPTPPPPQQQPAKHGKKHATPQAGSASEPDPFGRFD